MDDKETRLRNCRNAHQCDFKKVLCVCSAGMLRSATAAVVLAQEPFNFNTRAAGVSDFAIIPVDEVLIEWADEIVVMELWHLFEIQKRFKTKKKILVLGIPDQFGYRDPELMRLIEMQYKSALIRSVTIVRG